MLMKKSLINMAVTAGLCVLLSGCGGSGSSSDSGNGFMPKIEPSGNVLYYKGDADIKALKDAGFNPVMWDEKSYGPIFLSKSEFERIKANGFKSEALVKSFKANHPIFIDDANDDAEAAMCRILGLKVNDPDGECCSNAVFGIMKNKTGGISTFIHHKDNANLDLLEAEAGEKIAWIDADAGTCRVFSLPCKGFDDPYVAVNESILPAESEGRICLQREDGSVLKVDNDEIQPSIVILKKEGKTETWLQNEESADVLNYFSCDVDSSDKALCRISEDGEPIINFYLDGRPSEFLKKEPETHDGTSEIPEYKDLCYEQMMDWIESENGKVEESDQILSKSLAGASIKDNIAEIASMNCITLTNDNLGKSFVIKTYYTGVHTFQNGGDDYMYFRQECMIDGSGGYNGPHWVGGASRNGECVDNYMKEFSVSTKLDGTALPDSFLALPPTPTSVNKTTSYSTQTNWGLATDVKGSIGKKGSDTEMGIEAGLSMNWGITDTRSWSVQDVEVFGASPSLGQEVKWTHKYAIPKQNRACGKWQRIYEGANLGHSLYTPCHMWLWKIPSSRRSDNSSVTVSFNATKESMYTRNSGSIPPGTTSSSTSSSVKQSLVFPPTFALEKKELAVGKENSSYKIGVGYEGGDIILSSTVGWMSAIHDSDYIYITVSKNDTGAARGGVLKVSHGSDKFEIKVNQLPTDIK